MSRHRRRLRPAQLATGAAVALLAGTAIALAAAAVQDAWCRDGGVLLIALAVVAVADATARMIFRPVCRCHHPHTPDRPTNEHANEGVR